MVVEVLVAAAVKPANTLDAPALEAVLVVLVLLPPNAIPVVEGPGAPPGPALNDAPKTLLPAAAGVLVVAVAPNGWGAANPGNAGAAVGMLDAKENVLFVSGAALTAAGAVAEDEKDPKGFAVALLCGFGLELVAEGCMKVVAGAALLVDGKEDEPNAGIATGAATAVLLLLSAIVFPPNCWEGKLAIDEIDGADERFGAAENANAGAAASLFAAVVAVVEAVPVGKDNVKDGGAVEAAVAVAAEVAAEVAEVFAAAPLSLNAMPKGILGLDEADGVVLSGGLPGVILLPFVAEGGDLVDGAAVSATPPTLLLLLFESAAGVTPNEKEAFVGREGNDGFASAVGAADGAAAAFGSVNSPNENPAAWFDVAAGVDIVKEGTSGLLSTCFGGTTSPKLTECFCFSFTASGCLV